MVNKYKIGIPLILILSIMFIITVVAVEFTPQGNMNLRDTYGVYNATWVNASVFNSLVSTGTSPFIVASTTKVDNLNCDTVDGISGGSFLQNIVEDTTPTLGGNLDIESYNITDSSDNFNIYWDNTNSKLVIMVN